MSIWLDIVAWVVQSQGILTIVDDFKITLLGKRRDRLDTPTQPCGENTRFDDEFKIISTKYAYKIVSPDWLPTHSRKQV